MGLKSGEPVRQRVDSGAGGNEVQREKIAFAFGHFFAAGDDQKGAVHPEVEKGFAGGRFGLGDFIGVVDVHVIGSAAVDVQHVAQVFHAHGGALDVPAGKSHPPGRIPLHLPLNPLGRKFPQGEIGGVAFFGVFLHPRAFLQRFDILVGQFGVGLESGCIVIDAVRGAIGVPFGFQDPDQFDLVVDGFRGLAPDRGFQNVEAPDVLLECVGVIGGDLPGAAPLATRAGFELVFAHIPVAGKVAHIGDVHHMLDLQAVEGEHPLEDIAENIGPEVADVGVVVHGRTTGVETDAARKNRREGFPGARQGVVQMDSHDFPLTARCIVSRNSRTCPAIFATRRDRRPSHTIIDAPLLIWPLRDRLKPEPDGRVTCDSVTRLWSVCKSAPPRAEKDLPGE